MVISLVKCFLFVVIEIYTAFYGTFYSVSDKKKKKKKKKKKNESQLIISMNSIRNPEDSCPRNGFSVENRKIILGMKSQETPSMINFNLKCQSLDQQKYSYRLRTSTICNGILRD